jgi:hypothetical protein
MAVRRSLWPHRPLADIQHLDPDHPALAVKIEHDAWRHLFGAGGFGAGNIAAGPGKTGDQAREKVSAIAAAVPDQLPAKGALSKRR